MMGWFTKFIDSSIGKKLVMALTGIFLFTFLIVHLAGNLTLLIPDNGHSFNIYAEFMAAGVNIPIRIIEVFLFIFFIYHIVNGIRLYLKNKRSREINYSKNDPSENSSLFSRTMVFTGILVFLFLILHLWDFYFPFKFGGKTGMYEHVIGRFYDPLYSAIYITAFILLCGHLIHGVQSAFQTLGVRHKKYTPFIKNASITLSVIICIGFIIIPVYFLIQTMGGK